MDDHPLIIRPYEADDQDSVIELWNQCGLTVPWNDPVKDIQRKLTVNPEWFLVGVLDGKIIATLMVGYEGHRGWINYMAVDPRVQRQGIGRLILEAAEKRLRDTGCPKINLQVRSTNSDVIAFYESAGYKVDPVTSMGKRLVED